MAIKRPDIYEHNNPNMAFVDSHNVRGGKRKCQDLSELYALGSKSDQLNEYITEIYVIDENKDYLLVDINNVNNSNGWQRIYSDAATLQNMLDNNNVEATWQQGLVRIGYDTGEYRDFKFRSVGYEGTGFEITSAEIWANPEEGVGFMVQHNENGGTLSSGFYISSDAKDIFVSSAHDLDLAFQEQFKIVLGTPDEEAGGYYSQPRFFLTGAIAEIYNSNLISISTSGSSMNMQDDYLAFYSPQDITLEADRALIVYAYKTLELYTNNIDIFSSSEPGENGWAGLNVHVNDGALVLQGSGNHSSYVSSIGNDFIGTYIKSTDGIIRLDSAGSDGITEVGSGGLRIIENAIFEARGNAYFTEIRDLTQSGPQFNILKISQGDDFFFDSKKGYKLYGSPSSNFDLFLPAVFNYSADFAGRAKYVTTPSVIEDLDFIHKSYLVSGFVPYSGATGHVDIPLSFRMGAGYVGAGYGDGTSVPARLATRNPTIPGTGATQTVFGTYNSVGTRGFYVYVDEFDQHYVNNRGGGNQPTNSAFGNYSLSNNTTGTENTAYGSYSLRFNTTGIVNAAFGGYALYRNISGTRNAAFGSQSLYNLTEGSFNTAVASQSGLSLTTGDANTLIGQSSAAELTTGRKNTIIGRGAGNGIVTGSSNIVISQGWRSEEVGFSTGVVSGSNNVLIGYVHSMQPTDSKWIVIADTLGNRAFEKNGTTGQVDLKGNSLTFNNSTVALDQNIDLQYLVDQGRTYSSWTQGEMILGANFGEYSVFSFSTHGIEGTEFEYDQVAINVNPAEGAGLSASRIDEHNNYIGVGNGVSLFRYNNLTNKTLYTYLNTFDDTLPAEEEVIRMAAINWEGSAQSVIAKSNNVHIGTDFMRFRSDKKDLYDNMLMFDEGAIKLTNTDLVGEQYVSMTLYEGNINMDFSNNKSLGLTVTNGYVRYNENRALAHDFDFVHVKWVMDFIQQYSRMLYNDTFDRTVAYETGDTSSNKVTHIYSIQGGTVDYGTLTIDGLFTFTGSGTKSVRFFLNTVNSLTSGTPIDLAVINIGNADTTARLIKKLTIKNNNTIYAENAETTEIISGSTDAIPISVPFDPSNDYFIIVACEFDVMGDSAIQKNLEISFKKSK